MARILVIDDDRDTRILVKYILDQRGDEAVEAENGLQALSLLETDNQFDLIISDVRMPKMNGLSLLYHLRMLCPSTPVIFISTQRGCASLRAAIDESVSGYVQKPFTRKQLVDEINRVSPLRI